MTKSITKVIAALGVVAGLGVAVLPLSSYADSKDVTVQITIEATTGTVNPGCTTASDSGGAGEIIEADCSMTGSSNTGVKISIADKDSNLNLVGNQSPTPENIPALSATANLSDAQFDPANLGTSVPSGGAWGFKFVVGASTNLTTQGNYGNWNGITASDVVVAQSPNATVGVDMAGSKFSFRAVTPPSQAPGIYTDVVVVTVDTLP